MTIVLSAETQRLLDEKLRTGGYKSADEVLHAALQALNELESHALDDETLDAIDRAEDQIERGEVHDWKDVREQVRAPEISIDNHPQNPLNRPASTE